jgi:hypothetical protein
MSLPRPTPELLELLSAGTGSGSEQPDRDDERSASRDVLLASDDAVDRAIKRVTRDHLALITALAK